MSEADITISLVKGGPDLTSDVSPHLSAWEEIEQYEENWTPFEAQFRFRPSIHADGWPAIQEPTPSVTFDLAPVFTAQPAGFAAGEQAVNALALLAMLRTTSVAESVLVLDWQHTSYRFWPHRQLVNEPRPWPVGVFPNGDYYAFLIDNMNAGTFGHPWEETLCVFGESLLDVLVPMLTSWLPVKRSTDIRHRTLT